MKFLRRLVWRLVAQTGELRFHQRNAWRRSPDFMAQTRALFDWWGFKPDSFVDRTVIDIGAGSRLRSRYFEGARIVVIEPLADRFRSTIEWSDLSTAAKVYSAPAEAFVGELESAAALAICINVLDHVFDPVAVLQNASRYLSPDGQLLLSVDLHEHGEAGPMHPVHVDRAAIDAMLHNQGLTAIREFDGLGPIGKASYGHGRAYTVIARKV